MEENLIPKSESTTKVYQNTLGLSVAPSNPDEFPIVYADNVWDVVNSGTNLAELLENIGQFDQHTVNELFARILIEGPHYKILDPQYSFSSQVTSPNTVYEIRDVFDLGNIEFTVPDNCTFEFNGGKIVNATLNLTNTVIKNNGNQCFKNITLQGNYYGTLNPIMFGIMNDEEDPIQVLRETHTNSISLNCICEYSNISNIYIDNIPSSFSSIPLPRKVDFSNVTITVTNTTKNLFLFLYDNVSSLNSVDDITKEMTTTGNYTESTSLPNNCVLILSDINKWVERQSGNDTQTYRKDILLISNKIAANSPCFSYNTDQTSLSTKYFEITDFNDTLKYSNVNFIRSSNSSYKTYLIKIDCGYNVELDNINIITQPGTILINDTCIDLKNTYGVKLNNITIDGTYSSNNDWGYGIRMDYVSNIRIKNMITNTSWHEFGTTCVNDVYVENSITSFDCHCYCKDITVYNCTLTHTVSLGMVTGKVKFEKVTAYTDTTASFLVGSIGYENTLYDLIIKDCIIKEKINNASPYLVGLVSYNISNLREDIIVNQCPNLYVDNVKLIGGNGKIYGIGCRNTEANNESTHTFDNNPSVHIKNLKDIKFSVFISGEPINSTIEEVYVDNSSNITVTPASTTNVKINKIVYTNCNYYPELSTKFIADTIIHSKFKNCNCKITFMRSSETNKYTTFEDCIISLNDSSAESLYNAEYINCIFNNNNGTLYRIPENPLVNVDSILIKKCKATNKSNALFSNVLSNTSSNILSIQDEYTFSFNTDTKKFILPTIYCNLQADLPTLQSIVYCEAEILSTGKHLAWIDSSWVDIENGPSYKILNPQYSFLSQVRLSNTVYEIRDVFDLGNTTVTIPVGCTLKFEGGSIINGVVVGQDTIIDGIFNVDKVSGRFIKDDILIDPISYFKFKSDVTKPSNFTYSYIDTQAQFKSFLGTLETSGTNTIYGILAPKEFKWYFKWEEPGADQRYISYRYMYTKRDFYLVGTKTAYNQTKIDGCEEEYTRNDAIEFTGTHYKCQIKTNGRYSNLGYFPIFVNENDELIKVQTTINPSYGCLTVPSSQSSSCIFKTVDSKTYVQIPVDETLGDEYKNKSFTNAYGVIKVDYRYVFFELTNSTSDNFEGEVIYNPYATTKLLNYDYSNYYDKICYTIYNATTNEPNSIYYDSEYIYIPNHIKKAKFLGSGWKKTSYGYTSLTDRWFDIQGDSNKGYNVTFENIMFKNFGVCPIKVSDPPQQNINTNLNIYNCEFLNTARDAVNISFSSSLDNYVSTWKGVISEIRDCVFNKCCIITTTTDRAIITGRNLYSGSNNYPTTGDVNGRGYIDIHDCTFNAITNKEYYMCQKPGVALNSDSSLYNCKFINLTYAVTAFHGLVEIKDNIFDFNSDILNLPYPEFIHDSGVIYIGQISKSLTANNSRLDDERHKAIVKGNNIHPITPAIYGSQLSYSGIYLDDGRGNVIVDNNLVGPIGTSRYSIECRNITSGDYNDGYSSNRNQFTNNIVFNAYRMTYGSEIEKNGGEIPSVSNNIVITGEYANQNSLTVDISNDLPKPQYYYYDKDCGVVLPYNYVYNYVGNSEISSFPRSLKFVSRGGVNTVNNPVFGTTRPLKPHIGQMFFDTNLTPHKYICWNGTNWVNLDGTSLSSVEHE